jgi:ribosomal protein L24
MQNPSSGNTHHLKEIEPPSKRKNVFDEEENDDHTKNHVIPTTGNNWQKFKKRKDDLTPSEQETQQLREDLEILPQEEESVKYAPSDYAKRLLLGMGWKPNEAYGRSKKIVEPLVLKSVPKLSGLGSKPINDNPNKNRKEVENSLEKKLLAFPSSKIVIDSVVSLVNGPYEGLFGRVLTIYNEKLQVRLSDMRSVRVAFEDASLIDIKSLNEGHAIRVFCRQEEVEKIKSVEKMAIGKEEIDKRKITWLQPNLRVRVVSKSLGKYYKEKVLVLDVPDMYTCSIKTDDGKFLENIYESMVETVIPPKGETLMVVAGKFKGRKGILRQKDSENQMVAVEFDGTSEMIHFDDVCMLVE